MRKRGTPPVHKSKDEELESGKDVPEPRKNKADHAEVNGSGKKLKQMTRKRMREEFEERIGDMKVQRARIEEQGEIRRMRSLKRKLESPDEATFEADPQLPGRKDGARKILERLRNRSKGSRDTNSTRPCKRTHLHEREAITRLINGGGTSSSTDRKSTRGACGVGMPVSALA